LGLERGTARVCAAAQLVLIEATWKAN